MGDRLILKLDPKQGGHRLFESDSANPELYVDGIQGMMISGSVAKVNFFTRDYSSPEEHEKEGEIRRLACRLVMSVEAFISISEYLNTHAQDLKQKIQLQQKAQSNPS